MSCLGLVRIALLMLTSLTALSFAQRHAQLTSAEVDQLRDAAMEPDQRLKLYIKFLQARLATFEQVRTDSKLAPSDRSVAIHDHLEDFINLYDELNDNIDTYVDRKDDIRKPLKSVIEADTEFQNKLKVLRDVLLDGKQDSKPYEFVLSSAIDDVNSGATDHRQLLGELDEAAKHAKKKKREP